MRKTLLYCETNGYDVVISVDAEKNVRYLAETNDFPNMAGLDRAGRGELALQFLMSVEDDSSFKDDVLFSDIVDELLGPDADQGMYVIAHCEKEL